MSKLVRKLEHARYKYGTIGLLRMAVRRSRAAWLNYLGRSSSSRFYDSEFDRIHNTDTAGRIELADLKSMHADKINQCNRYEPISRGPFEEVLRRLPADPARCMFIDYGSGKGRALLLAAEHGFYKVIGIEFSSELCEVAKRNAVAYIQSSGSTTEIVVECIDAALFEVPPGNCVLYFFNPFGEELMAKVVKAIESALRRESREIYIIYFSPQWHKIFDRAGFFQRLESSMWSPDWYRVYKALPVS